MVSRHSSKKWITGITWLHCAATLNVILSLTANYVTTDRNLAVTIAIFLFNIVLGTAVILGESYVLYEQERKHKLIAFALISLNLIVAAWALLAQALIRM